MRFNGWTPEILFDTQPIMESNEGMMCGLKNEEFGNKPCEATNVEFEFVDLDDDGKLDVVMTLKNTSYWLDPATEERDPATQKSTTTVRKFRFTGAATEEMPEI